MDETQLGRGLENLPIQARTKLYGGTPQPGARNSTMMNGMMTGGAWMMTGMTLFALLTVAFLVLGVAALVKYLRTPGK